MKTNVESLRVHLSSERTATAGAGAQDEAMARTTGPALGPERDSHHTEARLSHSTAAVTYQKHSGTSLVMRLILPLIFLLLLPTLKLERQQSSCPWSAVRSSAVLSRLLHGGEQTTSSLLLELIRLPLERLRLEAGGLMLGASAKETGAKADLQEEETHTLMLAPAEHRASYMAAPGAGGHAHGYQYGAVSGESGPQGEMHVQAMPGADYAGDGAGGEHGGGPGAPEATVVSEPAGAQAGSALQARADLPAVRALNVKCEKNHMTVNIVFDRPFYGMVFSKGHYNDQKCVHLPPNSGQTSINFDIHLGKCGMSSSDAGPSAANQLAAGALQTGAGGQQPNGVFIENTIIIQYDPLVQEIYDQARKLRCTWYDYYEKSVTFRPYNVDMLDAVTANFLGDNIQCWMQIQVGKGPWSSEVAGIVKIGQTMTMVLAIKDDENRFDMLVRNCVAHDGKHQPIQLVDEYGCVARPKIMGKFQKVRNFGPAATVVSYAHFQAFKFPDSMSVHFQCVIQVCRYECPEPVCNQPAELGGGGGGGGAPATSSGQLSPTPGQPDYATSGTEMVASKMPSPGQQQQAYFSGAHPQVLTYTNHSHGGGGSQNVQLKLDDSQGRVQVKLDTSMMAGLAPRVQPTGGPPPPHLLHMASEQQAAGRGAYLSSSYYRPQTSGASAPTIVARGGATSGRQVATPPPPSVNLANSRLAAAAALPSGGSAQHQFSPQYVAARRSAYANRLGDLPAASATEQSAGDVHHLQMAPPYEAEYPLSLIASPRGLKSVGGGASAARVKRATEHKEAGRSARQASHLRADSTAVQTHKTIQVVSPDDVAFSLLDPDDERAGSSSESRSTLRTRLDTPPPASVCFSTTKFLWGALVTVAALASGIVVVTYVILRQRSQLDLKLASVFVEPNAAGRDYVDTPPRHHDIRQQQQVRTSHGGQLNAAPPSYCPASAAAAATATHLSQRQQEELQQRNNYLARLYSQFAPANYWR